MLYVIVGAENLREEKGKKKSNNREIMKLDREKSSLKGLCHGRKSLRL